MKRAVELHRIHWSWSRVQNEPSDKI